MVLVSAFHSGSARRSQEGQPDDDKPSAAEDQEIHPLHRRERVSPIAAVAESRKGKPSVARIQQDHEKSRTQEGLVNPHVGALTRGPALWGGPTFASRRNCGSKWWVAA